MVKQVVTIQNVSGLHARPANIFSKTAAKFPCEVRFTKDGKSYNGKSIVSVLSACAKCNTVIEIVCDGEEEAAALAAMVEAVESGLGE